MDIIVCMLYWNPDPIALTIPYLHISLRWYGIFFATGFMLGFPLFISLLKRFFFCSSKYTELEISRKATMLGDRFVLYLLVGTVIGARLGHLLFYEDPSFYWGNFYSIIAVWEGGLASHGSAIGIMLAIFLFRLRIQKDFPSLTWLRILDFVSVPTALCGAFIRIGNFVNQEVLGTASNLPWAVFFGSPLDGSPAMARHPAQLYEALGYFLIFGLLWRASLLKNIFLTPGKLIGLFLMSVFGLRLITECFKTEQSDLLQSFPLNMGQILSVPFVLLGLFFFFKRERQTLYDN
jgi:phosphatidylglycerol:prolipoprotein diacylglycerol transferase